MRIPMKPLSEVTSQAIRLLSEHLGVVDTFRFVNQFTNGHGDYTEERDTLFRDVSIDDVVSAIKKKQTNKSLGQRGRQRRVK